MSVLSKSSGRVVSPALAPAGFRQRSRIKQSWPLVAMLPKIYGLCQVSFFFLLRLILKQLKFKTAALFSSFFVRALN